MVIICRHCTCVSSYKYHDCCCHIKPRNMSNCDMNTWPCTTTTFKKQLIIISISLIDRTVIEKPTPHHCHPCTMHFESIYKMQLAKCTLRSYRLTITYNMLIVLVSFVDLFIYMETLYYEYLSNWLLPFVSYVSYGVAHTPCNWCAI